MPREPKSKTYRALVRLSSLKHQRDFLQGEMIDLSHAKADEVAELIALGMIEPAQAERPEGERETP